MELALLSKTAILSTMRLMNIMLIVVGAMILPIIGFMEPIQAQQSEQLIVFDNSPYFVLKAKAHDWDDPTTAIITKTRATLIQLMRDSLDYTPLIVIAPDLRTFDAYIGQKIPDWGAAVAIPEKQLIIIKSPAHFNLQKSYEELVSHEYAHLVVSHSCGWHTPPRWLNEGIAMVTSREWSWGDNLAMSKTAVFSSFISLDEIERLNRFNEGKAQVAYAQAYEAVNFMVTECGPMALSGFLNEIEQGKTIDEAMYTACGATLKEFEKDYKTYLQNRYNVASLFMDTIFLWIFLALVVVVGFFLRFKKRRAYYKKWAAEERLQSTDFDYGDPDQPEGPDDDEPWRN